MGIALFRGAFFLFPFNRGQPFDVLSVFLVTLSAVEGSFLLVSMMLSIVLQINI